MCIAFVKISENSSDKYKLIILSNRDEAFERPTSPMHWHDAILSGVDLQDNSKGTWLGMTKTGKIGMLLSITQPGETKIENAPSRGKIVHEFLKSENSVEFFEQLHKSASQFNGFLFVGLELNSENQYQINSLVNLFVEKIEIKSWTESNHFVFSNSPPHVPLKKVIYGHERFRDSLKNSNEMTNEKIFQELLNVATDRTRNYPDDQLKIHTGSDSDEYNAPLSSIFVRFPKLRYGSRCHTIITINQDNEVNILERRLIPSENIEESIWEDQRFQFNLIH